MPDSVHHPLDLTDTSGPYRPSRRIVFTGLASLGVAAALAGCGASGSGDADSDAGGPTGATSPTAKAGAELTKTSDVPVGGGVILTDQKIVVTQPTKGTFKAFTAVCTHQGFTVTSVEDDVINCNHHGSAFSAATGAVRNGPAQAALAEVAIKVSGTSVLAA